MNRDEIKILLRDIKVCYSRFDGVEKVDGQFRYNPEVIDAWYKRLGWMDYERAASILNRYMESENGTKTPGIALWLNNGKAQRETVECTAFYDRTSNTVVWTPEDGKRYELQGEWKDGCFEDTEGRRWAFQDE